MLSYEMFGFGLKYTKLGISNLLKYVSFIGLVSLILGLSDIFTEYNIAYLSYGERKN